ncbi:MAG: hypothetical protein ACI8WM_002529, partial [Burkholderiaceae bacterium]
MSTQIDIDFAHFRVGIFFGWSIGEFVDSAVGWARQYRAHAS